MSRLIRAAAVVLAVSLSPAVAWAAEPKNVLFSVAASVLAPPTPVRATDGKRHLVYELQIHNAGSRPVNIDRIEVRDGRSDRLVTSYTGEAIRQLLIQQPFTDPPKTSTIQAGVATILWFDVALPARRPVPASLVHRLRISGVTVAIGRARVGHGRPLSVGPPLRGSGIFDAHGCCGPGAHRLAIQEIDGVPWLSQRYGIDFVQVDAQGRTFQGPADQARSYFIFGDPVYSVADGVVTSVLDGRPTETPPTADPTLTPTNSVRIATGNHVIVRIARGVYAAYAHLQAGTIRVRLGQRVRRGKILARAGNSGNSNVPHLHFQLMDHNSVFVANGLPFVFDRFVIEQRMTSSPAEFDKTNVATFAPVGRSVRNEMPLQGEVLRFTGP